MPLILPEELEDQWLMSIDDDLDKQQIQDLIQSYPEDKLKAHTVSKLRGKEYAGNVKTISDLVVYEDLEF